MPNPAFDTPTVYGTYQARTAPGWLQGDNGERWQRALGDEKGGQPSPYATNYGQLDRMRQAVLVDIPGTGPADALDMIGADRVLPRKVVDQTTGLAESDAAYGERLRTCWDGPEGWAFAGSHGGLLLALARAGFPTGVSVGAVIIQRTKRYSYLSGAGTVVSPYVPVFATHSGWKMNGQGPQYWNQFTIMFGADTTFVQDLSSGSAKAQILNAAVRAWKPAKARYMGARVVVSGSVWGWPIGVTWGQAGRTWGGSVRFIAP